MASLTTLSARLQRLEQRAITATTTDRTAHRWTCEPPATDADLRLVLAYLLEAGAANLDDALGRELRRLIDATHQYDHPQEERR